ncbi:FAD/NAD(P)-binding domain-containing protein [Penicillium cinerascens]|uniref:FAD/NAD(P)-binding domain-containing protein n=1 Tax=Penicillium cinerascens TaxID=70096 RepID=A0A9W9MN56_9EURO|nr:FAD/NAD(P)-binding domain-containing protein [Penicillium cinerascens]KAJ5204343.1 FAD/NAD(P)-binding domain-containing protein [Penicillium cinerascens]
MAPLNIIICGGGCAGPALAYWLSRSGHQVTIVERFPALRATGAQIDLRGQGIEAAKRMGLLDTIRGKLVDEDGFAIVDSQGKVRATVMANKSGKGAQSLTSEYEIMRGDLVRILYDATKDKVKYIFDTSVDRFEQDEQKVTAYFSDGSSDTFDLLVGADGQGSRVRKAILPPGSPDPYRQLGFHAAYWFIPRNETDTNLSYTYQSPGGRMIMRRSHSPTETQIYFFLRDDALEFSSIHRGSVEQQKEFWTQKFRGAGWETDRFLEGMKTTNNWYCQEVVQVQTDTWHRGRVVLLGDAAHCPSPFSGMGTTAGLVGAYILAGEINRNTENLSQAFANYDKTLRTFVDEVQNVKPALLRLGMPLTWWGVAILHFIFGLACFLRLPDLISRFSKERDGDWKLPEYSELEYSRE